MVSGPSLCFIISFLQPRPHSIVNMDLALQLEKELTSVHDLFIESWESWNCSYLTLNGMVNDGQRPFSALIRDTVSVWFFSCFERSNQPTKDALLKQVAWFKTCYLAETALVVRQVGNLPCESYSEHLFRQNAKGLSALVGQLALFWVRRSFFCAFKIG